MAKRRFDLLPLPLPRQVRPNDTRKSKGRKDRRERETERMTKWTNDNSEGGGRREEGGMVSSRRRRRRGEHKDNWCYCRHSVNLLANADQHRIPNDDDDDDDDDDSERAFCGGRIIRGMEKQRRGRCLAGALLYVVACVGRKEKKCVPLEREERLVAHHQLPKISYLNPPKCFKIIKMLLLLIM